MRVTNRKPDFTQLEKVLRNEVPDRPVLFELIVSGDVRAQFADPATKKYWDQHDLTSSPFQISGFYELGYDYSTGLGSKFNFSYPHKEEAESIGQAEAGVITDRASFEAFDWKNPEDFDYDHLGTANLPEGMKHIVRGPCGVLENITSLVGFEDLCFMLVDEPELVQEIFDAIGSRLVRYYELSMPYDQVGAAIVNDDWGFKTQTMLSPDQMRTYVVPWHKKIVAAIHAAGKPAIMHSCGNLTVLWDDIIDEIGFDAKHSNEDTIFPIEQAIDEIGDRIALMGGIDLDFLCRKTPEEIKTRARALLEQTAEKGGYALGSGNSIPLYVPLENYRAMLDVALEQR